MLPSPLSIAKVFLEDYDQLAFHTWITTYEILCGFIIGALIGVLFAFLMTQFPAVRNVIVPIVIASQTTPKVAIAPLIIIWFGVGLGPKIMIVALLAFFPIMINAIAGIESTDEGHLALMRSVDASEAQVYWHIRLPTAMPFIFAGLKLGITVSVIGAIIAEWVAATEGLGYLILNYTQYFQIARTFAVLVVLIVLGLVLFWVIDLSERFLSWERRGKKTRHGANVYVAEASL
jgi:NitT/TauT family transport system permease protein